MSMWYRSLVESVGIDRRIKCKFRDGDEYILIIAGCKVYGVIHGGYLYNDKDAAEMLIREYNKTLDDGETPLRYWR